MSVGLLLGALETPQVSKGGTHIERIYGRDKGMDPNRPELITHAHSTCYQTAVV